MSQAVHIKRARQAQDAALQMLSGIGAETPDMLTKSDEAAALARDEIDAAIRAIRSPISKT